MKYLIFKNKVVDINKTEFPVSPEMEWIESDDLTIKKGFVYQDGQFIDPETLKTNEEKILEARNKRDQLLECSDWMVIKNIEPSSSLPEDVIAYRQALRDLPQDPNFPNVEFPTPPCQ